MMTKKDFIALANAIREHNTQSPFNVGLPFDDNHLDVLSAFCRSRNSRFNWNRWIDYIYGRCGPNGGAIRKPKKERSNETGEGVPSMLRATLHRSADS